MKYINEYNDYEKNLLNKVKVYGSEHLILHEDKDYIDLILTDKGKKILKECIDENLTDVNIEYIKEDEKSMYLNEEDFFEIFDGFSMLYGYKCILDISEVYNVLSTAPAIIKDNKFWYYDNYQIKNFVEVLYNEGKVRFIRGDE